MVFENGVKNIQAAAYNGAHTVLIFRIRSVWKISGQCALKRLLPLLPLLHAVTAVWTEFFSFAQKLWEIQFEIQRGVIFWLERTKTIIHISYNLMTNHHIDFLGKIYQNRPQYAVYVSYDGLDSSGLYGQTLPKTIQKFTNFWTT